MTPAQLRQLADAESAQVDLCRGELEKLRETYESEVERLNHRMRVHVARAELWRRTADELDTGGLHDPRVDGSISDVNLDTRGRPAAVKMGIARATRNHPAMAKLYRQGVTISALARVLEESRSRVSSWFAEGASFRPIPAHHADYLLKKYDIPLESWQRIAR